MTSLYTCQSLESIPGQNKHVYFTFWQILLTLEPNLPTRNGDWWLIRWSGVNDHGCRAWVSRAYAWGGHPTGEIAWIGGGHPAHTYRKPRVRWYPAGGTWRAVRPAIGCQKLFSVVAKVEGQQWCHWTGWGVGVRGWAAVGYKVQGETQSDEQLGRQLRQWGTNQIYWRQWESGFC